MRFRLGDNNKRHAISSVPPRSDDAGGDVNKRYDYQFQRAATACLNLLEEDGAICVLCEWHDDYVVERERTRCSFVLYGFHQVKTRESHLGPWSLAEIFGFYTDQKKREQKEVNVHAATSIAGRMFGHILNFDAACEAVILVTNIGVKKEVKELLAAVSKATSPADLTGEEGTGFRKIYDVYSKAFSGLDEEKFLGFLKRFGIKDEAGRLGQSENDLRSELALRILELSEMDLTTSQSLTICSELVAIVRERSQHQIPTTAVPLTIDDLRSRKGITVREVLDVIGLSMDGYKQLRESGDKNIVRSISRFKRICELNGIDKEIIPTLCAYKTNWDLWRRSQRWYLNQADDLDFVALTNECKGLIKLQASGNLPFAKLAESAQELANRFTGSLGTTAPLTRELVVGFVFALIAESEQMQ